MSELPLYCGEQDVRAYLPLDLPSSLNPALIQQVIADESRYVDDYLAGQYQVPFPGYPKTPGSVKKATAMLAMYSLYVHMGMSSEKDDPRQSLWRRAHEILDKIRDRLIILGSGESLEGAVRETPPILTGPATGPASFAHQNRELGPLRRPMSGGLAWPLPEDDAP